MFTLWGTKLGLLISAARYGVTALAALQPVTGPANARLLTWMLVAATWVTAQILLRKGFLGAGASANPVVGVGLLVAGGIGLVAGLRFLRSRTSAVLDSPRRDQIGASASEAPLALWLSKYPASGGLLLLAMVLAGVLLRPGTNIALATGAAGVLVFVLGQSLSTRVRLGVQWLGLLAVAFGVGSLTSSGWWSWLFAK